MNDYDRRSPAGPANWLTVLLLFVIAGLLIWQLFPRQASLFDPEAEPRPITPRGELAEDEKAIISLFKTVSPSVVHITTLVAARQDFFLDVQQIPQGSGSGFVWDKKGHIVTNYHVIQNANGARVMLGDNTSYDARIVGAYPDSDLAVLWIDAPPQRLQPILIGESGDLQVGQKAFAIGNPFGLDQTLTTGIISALGREIESVTRRPIKGVIQTDAAINPGNSGGPLLDSAGRLVGVNTAIFSPSGASAGIGFAIPVDEVNRIVPQLIRAGKVTRPGLGVQVAPDQLTEKLGIDGVLIMTVQPGSPAQAAGLRATRRDARGRILLGDVITAINEKAIAKVNDLFDVLQEHQVGDTVTVTILRDGEAMDVKMKLDAIQ